MDKSIIIAALFILFISACQSNPKVEQNSEYYQLFISFVLHWSTIENCSFTITI